LFAATKVFVHEPQNTAVRNDKNAPTSIVRHDVVKGCLSTRGRRGNRFKIGWTAIGLKVARPLRTDLSLGHALPFAGAIFSPTWVESVGRTSDDRGNGLSGDSSTFKITRHDDVKSGAFSGK
jgi:hypothetical protein